MGPGDRLPACSPSLTVPARSGDRGIHEAAAGHSLAGRVHADQFGRAHQRPHGRADRLGRSQCQPLESSSDSGDSAARGNVDRRRHSAESSVRTKPGLHRQRGRSRGRVEYDSHRSCKDDTENLYRWHPWCYNRNQRRCQRRNRFCWSTRHDQLLASV